MLSNLVQGPHTDERMRKLDSEDISHVSCIAVASTVHTLTQEMH